MKIRLVGNEGTPQLAQFATSFLIDDTIAVDAGTLGFGLTLPEQERIQDVLLTHVHLDHVCSLPILLDNVFAPGRPPLRLHAHPEAAADLRRYLFNDRIWPDLVRIGEEGMPMIEIVPFEKEKPFQLGQIRVTPIAVSHTVPCFSFLFEGKTGAALFVGDTGPTRRVWEFASRVEDLRWVFLEASFPNAEDELARITKHLTPSRLATEKAKVETGATFVAYHLKARHAEAVAAELKALGDTAIEVARVNEEYRA